MATREEDDEGVFPCRSSGGVEAGGDVDVEGGVCGKGVGFEDLIKRFAVFFGEEDVVCFELGDGGVEGPVKGEA